MDMNTSEPVNPDAARDEMYALQNRSEALAQRDLIEGRRYVGGNHWTGLDTTAYYELENTSSDKWLFIQSDVGASGGAWLIRSYEPTTDTAGTSDDVITADDGTPTDDVGSVIDSTYTDTGNEFPRELAGAGGNPNQQESGRIGDYNLYLKPGERALFQIIPLNGNTIDVSLYANITAVNADEV